MQHPDNIDDLFRQQLEGHATPPAPDLWQRLALPAAEAAPVDAAFQEGLRDHAPPPRRELWERLEDEYLRPQPRRRRVVAWWQLSAAAVLLLLLLAGGLLWRGSYLEAPGHNVAHLGSGTSKTHPQPGQRPNTITEQPSTTQPAAQAPDLATTSATHPTAQKKNQESFSTQATAATASTSSTPIATTTQPRRAATATRAASGHQALRQRPDADAGTLANLGGRKTPTGQSSTTPQEASTTPVVSAARPAETLPALASTTDAAPEIIEVDVRRGPAAARPAPAVVAATEAPAARRRGLRLGGLLRQADHLVHGEPVNLAEATGLPENVTVQARLGGRLISKTIQL